MTKTLTLTPIVDPAKAESGIKQISGRFSGLSNALAGVQKKGQKSFSGLATAISNSGLMNEFGGIQNVLMGLGGSFEVLNEKGKVSFSKLAVSAGVGLAAVGAVANTLGDPLEAATAQLDQTLKNAGSSLTSGSAPIKTAQAQMQGLGHTYTDTDQALEVLTQGLGSPKKALGDLGVAANLAARDHTSLASAAQQLVKLYAGSTRELKEFGINTTAINKASTAATAAQKAHTTAVTDAGKANERLSELEERLAASRGTKGVSAANSVASAQTALTAAEEHLQQVQEKVNDGSIKSTSVTADLEAANQRLTTAQQRLADAQGKANDTGSLTVSQQQELANAKQAAAAANAKVISTEKTALATQKDLNTANISGQKAVDLVSKATHGLAQAQANTFGGQLQKWKTTVADFGAQFGATFGHDLIIAGPALAGVGALVDSGFFGVIGRGAKALPGLLKTPLSEIGKLSGAASGAGDAAATAAGDVEGLGAKAGAATPEITGAGAAAATAAGEETEMGASAATAAGEVSGLGEASEAAGAEEAGGGALGGAGAAGLAARGAGALGTAVAGAGALFAGYQVGSALNSKFGISNRIAGLFGSNGLTSASQTSAVSTRFEQQRYNTLTGMIAGGNVSNRTLAGIATFAAMLGKTNVSQIAGTSHLPHADMDYLAQALAKAITSQSKVAGTTTHYHDTVSVGTVNVKANDMRDTINQVQKMKAKANFSGEGTPGG